MLTVQSFVNTPVSSNCYVLFDWDFGNDCIIVDPGSRSEKELIDYLEGEYLVPKFIILTHEHFDHCWGVNELVNKYHIPVVCSELCAEAIKHEKKNCSVFYDKIESFVINNKTIKVEDIDYELLFDGKKIRFFLTPGHTEASICFVLNSMLFTGDTLIKDERTFTKLPTGSIERLKDTLSVLEEFKGKGYVVYPGHGDVILLDNYDLNLA